ncbi:hypothetical protein PTTG_29851 [Puccinia triticina 1-1 BBBD Race 1]|uniref:Tyrosine specific protein phosphatases domain-containing protein n=1 Tax=Puccinia triticina (isolate 1-1 / race 1 (BBBD)) TaxID=630390 RepID=A0A180G1N8_PUCT1|nr:hypothetical protein PTTG_29851 [Puccinia triticina 1-1 BBBD Race 1]
MNHVNKDLKGDGENLGLALGLKKDSTGIPGGRIAKSCRLLGIFFSPHITSTNRTAALGRCSQPTPRVVNSLWHEWTSGPMEMLDMKGVADDGMDLIRPHIERAMAFIEACRVAGGKVLVHCLVGVSRSASIVIAHVMKHCRLDLTSAYLMVRSRRLNILLQPNHLFMWSIKRLQNDLVASAAANACTYRPINSRLVMKAVQSFYTI